MKKTIYFIFLSILCLGCSKKESTLQFSTKTIDYKTQKNCTEGNCTYVHLEIPIALGSTEPAYNINQTLFDFVNKNLSFQNNKTTKSYDTLALHFIKQYDDVFLTYPENALAWEANFKSNHRSISNKIYQFVFDYYLFTGGAHGLQACKVFLFDPSTGKQLPKKDLFLNYNGFEKYAEDIFKKQLHISGDLNSVGFNFENNKFKLPENFYQTNTHWILHYNPYEIAPYVKGTTVIKLPKSDVERFLNPIYFKN
ncbi:MAG: DUF3298 domain-containing protein [Myroides sp.]|nr:DUF3298 domain-containing protein [Myroides sp.]